MTDEISRNGGTGLDTRSPGRDRLAMHGVTTIRWSLTEDVVAASEFGLTNIGLWRRKVHDFGEEKSVELLHDHNMHVSSLSWAGGFTGFHGYSFREAMADATDAVDLAKQLQADCLILTSGGRAMHTRNNARRLLIDALRELGDYAGERGVTLAVQPMHDIFAGDASFLTDLDSTIDVLAEVDRAGDDIQIAFDVYHFAEDDCLVDRIPELTPRLAVVQLNDGTYPPKSKYDRCRLGEGEIPLREIVSTLHTSGYGGCYEIALWSHRIWRSDYRNLFADCVRGFDALCGRGEG